MFIVLTVVRYIQDLSSNGGIFFANVRFTMSMKEHVDLNSTNDHGTSHWSSILNVPGEAFGDDSM